MSQSVRQNILQALQALYTSVEAGQPVDNPYTLRWSDVTRLPVKQMRPGARSLIGIYATQENKTSMVGPTVTVSMDCVLEMHINKDTGENLADMLETALSESERRLMEDQTLGGLCLDINVRQTETDVGGFFANVGSASLFFTVLYRHHRDDPARNPADSGQDQ